MDLRRITDGLTAYHRRTYGVSPMDLRRITDGLTAYHRRTYTTTAMDLRQGADFALKASPREVFANDRIILGDQRSDAVIRLILTNVLLTFCNVCPKVPSCACLRFNHYKERRQSLPKRETIVAREENNHYAGGKQSLRRKEFIVIKRDEPLPFNHIFYVTG